MASRKVTELLRATLPKPFRHLLARLRARLLGSEHGYRHLPAEELFDKIYEMGGWGVDDRGQSISGSGSHTNRIVDPYVDTVARFLDSLDEPTVVDLGCGDFNVGKRLVALTKNYIACDVSSIILERNKNEFQLDNLEFRQLNIAKDELPEADVAFVRQVLQHLSNAEIFRFAESLNSLRPYRYVIVTEHVPDSDQYEPNVDKPSGPGVRVRMNSGVDLSTYPFNLRHEKKTVLLSVDEDVDGTPAKIISTLYQI